MIRKSIPFTILGLLLILTCIPCHSADFKTASSTKSIPIQRIFEVWKGDLPEIIDSRRVIRVLVSYNSTGFFIEKGLPKGLEYELLREYEKSLNKNQVKKALKVKLVFRVLPFDQLLPALQEGRGDIAAAGITITPARSKKVAFTTPYIRNINEIVVASKKVTGLESFKDISGRRVNVVAGSSFVGHLHRLNRDLATLGLKPIEIRESDEHLEAEDILQMVNAGIWDLTVVDSHVAEIWSKVLNDLVVQNDIIINQGGNIAWAVRKESPGLLKSLNAFVQKNRQGTLLGNILIKRYYQDTRWLTDPVRGSDRVQLQKLSAIFQKYGKQYNIDWLKLAALAYQESRLDQNAKSHRGAVGIMQILPSTAAGKAVQIPDISTVENNIHAGTKYLAYLRDRYFDSPDISAEDQIDFSFAAYNAGPARINGLRKKAAKQGLDPNRWFNNVEVIARQEIGRETVQYVTNIYMYYIAYKTSWGVIESRDRKFESKSGQKG